MNSTDLTATYTSASMTSASSVPTRWYDALSRYQQQGIAHVLATVVAVNGSAPRALQAKMVITLEDCCDTLGGGGLEHDVISTARQLLKGEIDSHSSKLSVLKSSATKLSATKLSDFEDVDSEKDQIYTDEKASKNSKAVRRESVYTKHYPLGAKLGQCCGGSVTVMFESFNVTPPLSILVFGAGHVAAALMTILAELPCQVDWVDSRAERFTRYVQAETSITGSSLIDSEAPSQSSAYQLPKHIRVHVDEEPVDHIRPFIQQGGQRFVLIMTHDHSLDFELVREALDVIKAENCAKVNAGANQDQTDEQIMQGSAIYIGCIGSATKAKRFQDRLSQRGYSEALISNLTMPIGLAIGGKEPMAVAVSITAQIMQQYHRL